MRCETIGRRDVDSFKVWTPVVLTTNAIADCAEELLVPANRAKKLRRKLVFCLDIIRECVCISHERDFKPRFIKLGPKLQMMPCETDVLSQNKFSIVVDVAPGRQSGFGFAPKIRTLACRQPKIPALVRPKADAP